MGRHTLGNRWTPDPAARAPPGRRLRDADLHQEVGTSSQAPGVMRLPGQPMPLMDSFVPRQLSDRGKGTEVNFHQHIKGHLRRYSRLATLIAASAIAISAGLAVSGAAQAATNAPSHASAAGVRTATMTPAIQYSCFGTPHVLGSRYCYFQTTNGHAPLYNPDGSLKERLPLNDKVEINCYYYSGSTVEDHVSWTQATGNFTGHIPDSYINEGGSNPWESPGDLPQCG